MTDALIAGGAILRFGWYRDGSGVRDWVRGVAAEAIAQSGIAPGDIDAVVVASESDHMSLQLSIGALLTDEIGLVPKPVMRVEMGGASGAIAVRAGLLHIWSGSAGCVLVVGFEHAASHLSADDVRQLYALSFDADIEGMAGIGAVQLYALSIREHMRRFATTEEQLAAVSVKNHGHACGNPFAHKPMRISVADVLASRPVSTPYKVLDCSMISDGAAALVMVAAERAPGTLRPRIRVAGAGSASDWVRLGDRPEPHRFAAKTLAAKAAYAMAGIADPARAVGAAEVYDAFTGAELQAIEALGLCAEGEAASRLAAGAFGRDGPLPVNLSGGLIGQGGAPGAVGIAQVVTLSRILEGAYWPDLQPPHMPRIAVADAHSGIATVNVVHVLERID